MRKPSLKDYTDEELKNELESRGKERYNELKHKWDTCQHDWAYWSDYYSKGRDCIKCGKQE